MPDKIDFETLDAMIGEDAPECPIARHIGDGVMGMYSYDTREEAVKAWNRRATDER